MATKSQEILLKGNTTSASAVPSSLKVREIAINALDRSLFTNDGNSIVKLYTGTNKWFDVNGNANNALKLGGVLASEYINKEAFNSHINNSIIHITAAERTAWNNKWDYNEEIIKAVKVNAAVLSDSATKLQTPRTLWGQSFDGSMDVTAPAKMQYLEFANVGSNSIGYIGKGASDADTLFLGTYVESDVYLFSRYLSSSLILKPSGNVLVGTTTDNGSKMMIQSSVSSSARPTLGNLKGNIVTIGSSGYYGLHLWNEGSGDGFIQVGRSDGNATAYNLVLQPLGGNILIGTTTDNGYKLDVNGKGHYSGDLVCGGEVVAVAGEGTPAGVTDYSALTGKPSINGVTLASGNNTLASLGIQAAGDYATNSGVTTLLADYAKKTFVSNNYVGKSAFNSHTADTDIHITSAERVAWNAKWDYNEATIKAVKVTSASSADSVAWSGISDKPTTFAPSAHTHTASEVTGLPTSLKNPYALTFGSKSYDGSAAATITASDLGALTSITKSMVEGVLTGNITSHTHTFDSLTSKPTTIAGYGITDALTTSNYNSYAPTLTGTGASGTWGINISGNAATATNADKLDGVHYQNILERQSSGASLSGTATGWFRIAETLIVDSNGPTFLLAIQRSYSYANNESYLFSISISYNGGISITQLSGYANTRLIEKIRVDRVNERIAYIDLYINTSTTDNWYSWYTVGCAKSYTAWTANPTLVGTAYEFTTVQGCKSDRGFTGDLIGNATSATKLQTPRTIWGQSFDGTGNIDTTTYGMMRWLYFSNSSGVEQGYIGRGSDTNDIYLAAYGENSLHFITNSTRRATINPNGNILIGTTTDNGYKLQVNGSERVYGDLIVDGEVSALVA